MQNDDSEEKKSRRNYKIGIIGGTGSGKTTFIVALEKYARQLAEGDESYWIFEGYGDDTDTWLNEKVVLLEDGNFPGSTWQPTILDLHLYNRKNNHNEWDGEIITEDRAGGDYSGMSPEVIKFLSDCDGLIFLINPNMRPGIKTSELIKRLCQKIDKQKSQESVPGNQLKQRVSVCLSQCDEEEFFAWLNGQEGFLEFVSENGLENVPHLTPEKVRDCFRRWKNFSDGQEILNVFYTRFEHQKVNFWLYLP
jgi:energy-coupling factor transporter ATP-binding protein EcfA2